MLAVDFGSEVITATAFPNRKFIPVLDTNAPLSTLIKKLELLNEKYEVIDVFLAGDNIVGSCADVGDYTALCLEIK